jgi:hypothetical protein
MGSGVWQRRKKTEWPVWPALLLEHVTADEAKIKGGKLDTAQTSWSASLALEGARCVCIYVARFSKLRQNRLSEVKEKTTRR